MHRHLSEEHPCSCRYGGHCRRAARGWAREAAPGSRSANTSERADRAWLYPGRLSAPGPGDRPAGSRGSCRSTDTTAQPAGCRPSARTTHRRHDDHRATGRAATCRACQSVPTGLRRCAQGRPRGPLSEAIMIVRGRPCADIAGLRHPKGGFVFLSPSFYIMGLTETWGLLGEEHPGPGRRPDSVPRFGVCPETAYGLCQGLLQGRAEG